MGYDYSENVLVQNSAGNLLRDELGWEVAYAYNTEKLGVDGTFGRKNYREIVLWRYFRQVVIKLNPRLTEAHDRLFPKLNEQRNRGVKNGFRNYTSNYRNDCSNRRNHP